MFRYEYKNIENKLLTSLIFLNEKKKHIFAVSENRNCVPVVTNRVKYKHYTITTTLQAIEQSMKSVVSHGVPLRSVTLKNRTNKESSENDSQATSVKQLIILY